MNIKKLNEEIEKYLSINEISDELKQRYIDGRKKQLADLKAQLDENPLFKASKLVTDKRNRVNKMYSRNSISNDKYLIGKFNDINFYVAYKIANYSENAILLIERNGEILNNMLTGAGSLEKIVKYYLTAEILNLLAKYIEQGKIKSSKDIQMQLPSITIEYMSLRLDTPIIDKLGTNTDWVPDFIKNLKPDRKLDKLVQELQQTVFSESFELNELNSSTLKNYKKKVEDDEQKAIDDYWKLRDDEEFNKQRDELANKINRLEKKIADGQDMIQGKNIQKRILARGTWIVDLFEKLDAITEQIKNKYEQFSIQVEKRLKDQVYNVIIGIPIDQDKSCSVSVSIHFLQKTTRGLYERYVTLEVFGEGLTDNHKNQIKQIFKYSIPVLGKVKSTEEEYLKYYKRDMIKCLESVIRFIPTLQKRVNRAPRQEANYITLFKEKSQWGLDIQLKEMPKGYQVISHVGGYDEEGYYDPNMETDTMSGVSKNWRKTIDQAVKTCIEEDDLIDNLLYSGEMYDAFGDNEYAEYFLSELQKAYDEQNPEDEE